MRKALKRPFKKLTSSTENNRSFSTTIMKSLEIVYCNRYNNDINELRMGLNLNIFKQFFYSLYDLKKVSTFRFYKMRHAVFYVFLIAFIVFIPTLINGSRDVVKTRAYFADSKTEFEIKDGKLTTNLDKPKEIELNSGIIVVDSDAANEDELKEAMDDANAKFIIGEKAFAFGEDAGYTEIKYDKIGLENLKKDELSIAPFYFFIFFGAYYLTLAGFTFAIISLVALLTNLVGQSMKRGVNYTQSWKLTTYALTIPAIFACIMNLLDSSPSYLLGVLWLTALAIYIFTVKEIPKIKTEKKEKK